MGKLTELEQWDEDVYQIETSDPVLGGPEGITNKPQKQLANRTQWLKKRLEETNNALAEHEKSRNHPDGTLTDKGFVKLYSGVTSLDETMAATPKAVKIAMDNANERLAKARNLSDLTNVPLALQSLTIADTKKAVEDTQIGLSAQSVMLINTADDLSSLPAGARRFTKNNTGVTVLPTADYCYIEVLAKRNTASGTCIKVVEYSNPGNAWTGIRNNVPADAEFTWVQQYNESHKPPQQAMPEIPDALIRGNNLSDLTDPPEAVENLRLTETVNLAAGAMQKNQNGADIPDKPLFVRTLGIVDSYPAGCPIPYPGQTAPDGYLLMDGRPFSKTLYPQLAKFYVDGVLSDMRGMYIRGWDNGRGLDTPNGYAGHLRTIIGENSRREDINTKEYYSLRGYRIYVDDRNLPYESGRALLKPQYLDSVISDREPDTNRLLHMEHYDNPSYQQIAPPGFYQNDSQFLKYMPSASGISFYRKTATGAFIPSYENNGMVRLGSPNTTYNYITKAA
ncbi:tail fiber protein [Salmonella enterica]|nr:tail fiber protein [Salmonella enterica subsp. diarizonae]ELE1935830.1 tail fiber protein [Salmonella enterica]